MKRNGLLILMILMVCNAALAQEKKLVIQGNQLYEQKKYKEAQAAYQQALQKNPGYIPGAFNLGNTLIQQKQYDAARKVMANTAKNAREKGQQGGANYNIGNTYMTEQKWSEAVEAYKQALRKNPQDEDAKYNLSYALTKMKQDQNSKDKNKNKDQNKDNKDNKDKKDQQDKNKQDNKDGNDKKDQDKKGDQNKPKDNKEGKDKEDKRPEPRPGNLSEQQADNLLKALQQDERKLQEKKQQEKGVPVKVDKDW